MNDEKNSKHAGLRISKVVLLSILKIGIPVIVGAMVLIELFDLVANKKIQAQEASMSADTFETEEEVTYVDNPLLHDEVSEIKSFIEEYYVALANGDMDKVASMQDEISDTERITIEKKSAYIENYENVTCYTKNGMEDGAYYVFAVSDVKFYDVEATAPAMNVYYIYTKEDGSFVIDGNMDDDVLDTLPDVYADTEVSDLFDKVDVAYTEAVNTNEELNAFLTELPTHLKTEVGEALAMLETSESQDEANPASENETTEETAEVNNEVSTIIQVKATDTVNVRKSDSSEADKVGKVSEGEVLTCLEQKINGWSKVLYEGTEAYIKTMYLEEIKTEAEGEVIGTVKALDNVNVRSEANQSSSKLGVAKKGTSYNLLEILDGWYRIDFEGHNGYVKADYFEQ